MKTLLTIFGSISIIALVSPCFGQSTDKKQTSDITEVKEKTNVAQDVQKISGALPAEDTSYIDENGRNIKIIDGRKVIMVGDDGAQSLINPDYIQQKTDVNYKQTQQTINEPKK